MEFAVLADHRVKLKESKKDKYLGLARELKKLWNMEVTVIPILIGPLGTVTKRLVKRTLGLGNKRTSGEHPNYSIVEISQNTEKCPGDLRLVVTPVKDHQLILRKKNSPGVK